MRLSELFKFPRQLGLMQIKISRKMKMVFSKIVLVDSKKDINEALKDEAVEDSKTNEDEAFTNDVAEDSKKDVAPKTKEFLWRVP